MTSAWQTEHQGVDLYSVEQAEKTAGASLLAMD
jgi:hypothetical protein